MFDGLPYSRLVSFNDGAPDGAVVWVLRDIAGTEIAFGRITPDSGAVSVSIVIDAAHNTLQPADPLRVTRDLSWSYSTGGSTRAGRERYFVEGSVPFPVSEKGVRNLLGSPAHNLPDEEIDLIGAYWRIQTEGGADRLASFENADGENSMVIARGIEANAALDLLPTMSLRLAQKESSGTDSYSRHDTDWTKIESILHQHYHAALALISGEDAFSPGQIFQLTNPVDRFNPGT